MPPVTIGVFRGPCFAGNGEFVPLDRQDIARWSQPMIEEAENHLRLAVAFKCVGRYQLEAAIQSVHAGRQPD